MPKNPASFLDEHQKNFVKVICAISRRYRTHEVFRDFCELAAISISNAVDIAQSANRTARYHAIRERYEMAEFSRFPELLGLLTLSLAERFHDSLGEIFMSMDFGDNWKGQFFTPYHVCRLMAELSTPDPKEAISHKGYFTVNEPAAGAGSMVIALAESLRDRGFNYQQCMHVTAQDVDETAVHMSYIQLSLLHVPCVVIRGNTLAVECLDSWYTPAHILGGWSYKLREKSEPQMVALSSADAIETTQSLPLTENYSVAPAQAQLDLFV